MLFESIVQVVGLFVCVEWMRGHVVIGLTEHHSQISGMLCWKYGFNVTVVYRVGNNGAHIIGTVYRYLSWI